MSKNVYSIVLAAGQGTRMKSKLPKVLHKVGGKPMVGHLIDVLNKVNADEVIVVVGHKAEDIKEYIGDKVKYALQEKQLGTGHAVLQTKSFLDNKEGITIVLSGDTPLLTVDTIKDLFKYHEENDSSATILTNDLFNPTGYGRIVRSDLGEVLKIVEEKDANANEKLIKEVNSGIYCFDNQKLFHALEKVTNNNIQGEYYLTDVIEILRENKEKVSAFKINDYTETIGINDRVTLAKAEKIYKQRIMEKHMRNGVTIIDPDNTYIDSDVEIKSDTIIHPGTYLRGNTIIGVDCNIGPNVDVTDSVINDNVSISYTVVLSSTINNKAIVGPYAYIRPGSVIGNSVKIGDFVEIKNSIIGTGTKVPHLSYIGDADLGENINIGCGTITVNYDGVKKHRTEIKDGAFVGCNSNLVAPVSVGKDTYVAAGSTITDNVPDYALAIARQRQTNKEEYAKKVKEKKQK